MIDLTCPACGTSNLLVTFQVMVTFGQAGPIYDPATSDDFIRASCDNLRCGYALDQDPGDGRLRRAGLTLDDADVDDPDLEEKFREAVERVIAHDQST